MPSVLAQTALLTPDPSLLITSSPVHSAVCLLSSTVCFLLQVIQITVSKKSPQNGSQPHETTKLGRFFLRMCANLQGKCLQIFAEFRPHIRTIQCKFNRGLQHSKFVAGVEPFSFKCVAKYLLGF